MTDAARKFRVSGFGFRVGPSKLETRNSKQSCKGQALLELAALGSLMIVVLGAIVNYGLNADFTQQATMRSFRQSLTSAAEATVDGRPSSVSYLGIDERHIPSPSNPFAMGSILPMAAEGRSVSRNFEGQKVGNEVAELPRMRMIVQGQEINCPSANPAQEVFGCTTSGFRTERLVPPGSPKRYVDIYSRSNVCDKPECGGVCVQRDKKTKECKVASMLNIIDRCEGEIITNFEDCVRQARQIVDPQVCASLCEKGKAPGSPINCEEICNEPINVPWYAQGGSEASGTHEAGTHQWTFPKLEALFTGVKTLGLQPEYTKATTSDTGLARQDCVRDPQTNECVDEEEDDDKKLKTQTTSHVLWNDKTTRRVLYKPLGDQSGTPTTLQNETTPRHENSTTTWTTPGN